MHRHVGPRIRKLAQEASFDRRGVADTRPGPAQGPSGRGSGRPVVVLGLEIVERRKGAQRQEARFEIPDRALDLALRRGSAWSQNDRSSRESAKEGGDLAMQPGSAVLSCGDDRGVVVEDQSLRHSAQAFEAAQDRSGRVGHGSIEGEDRGVGSAVRQADHQGEGFACPASSDRDLGSGVPPVDLADFTWPIRRALEASSREERGTDHLQVVLEDRDPTSIAVGSKPLADHRRGSLRIDVEQSRDRSR